MSQKPQLEIAHSELVNDFLLIKWTDETESIISFQTLRDNCPCASCAGETDALGNVYKGPEKLKSDSSYQLTQIEPVGYYGLRPHWGDQHNTGIFSFHVLKSLSDSS